MDYPPLYNELQDVGSTAAQLRRNRSTLTIVGTGVIAIGLWTVAKTLFFLIGPQTQELVATDGNSQPVIVSTFVFLAFDLALRLYVGLSARSKNRGSSRGILFLAATTLLVATSVLSVVLEILAFTNGVIGFITFGVDVTIEVTCILAMTEMMAASLRVRRLSRQEA